jgi:hypothetical protein
MKKLGSWVVCVAVLASCAACGGSSSAVTPEEAADALLGAPGFAIHEVDRSSSSTSSGQFVTTFIGERTRLATEASVVKTGNNPSSYTLYATRRTYCHVGTNLTGGGFCMPGDGMNDFITFVSFSILKEIADGQTHVHANGPNFTFSGSGTSGSAKPTIFVEWQGTGRIAGGYVASLQYRVSDSQGGNQNIAAEYSHVGTSIPIHPPPRLPS